MLVVRSGSFLLIPVLEVCAECAKRRATCVQAGPGLACNECRKRKSRCDLASQGKAASGGGPKEKGKAKEETSAGGSDAGGSRRRRGSALDSGRSKRRRGRAAPGPPPRVRPAAVVNLGERLMTTLQQFDDAAGVLSDLGRQLAMLAGALRHEFDTVVRLVEVGLSEDEGDEDVDAEGEGE